MIVVGLTGNFASGKSEATRLFAKMGAKVFDADLEAKKALDKGKPAYQAVRKIFGPDYFLKNGQVDRKKLGEHVFNHPADLKKLNILIHPGVIFACLKLIEQNRSKAGLLVLDVPLLFESRMENLADVIVVVKAPTKDILSRAQKKRGMDLKLVKKILASQWSIHQKVKLAHFVIQNKGDLKQLEKQVKDVSEKILAKKFKNNKEEA